MSPDEDPIQRSTIILPTHAPCQRSDDSVEMDHLDDDRMHRLYSEHAAALRNMIIDDRRSPRFRNEVDSLEALGVREPAGPDEVNSTLDRLMIGDALAKLSAVHLAVVGRSYYLGWTTAHIADELQIAEGTVKSRLHSAVRTLRLTLQEMGVTRITQFGCVGAPVRSTDTHPDADPGIAGGCTKTDLASSK